MLRSSEQIPACIPPPQHIDGLRYSLRLRTVPFLWLAVEEPVGGRLLQIITHFRPIHVNDIWIFQKVVLEEVWLSPRILKDHTDIEPCDNRNESDEPSVEIIPTSLTFENLSNLLFKIHTSVVVACEIERRHGLLAEVDAGIECDYQLVLFDVVED